MFCAFVCFELGVDRGNHSSRAGIWLVALFLADGHYHDLRISPLYVLLAGLSCSLF